MMATQLILLLPGGKGPRWLVRNHRYFGVAAFGDAVFNLID